MMMLLPALFNGKLMQNHSICICCNLKVSKLNPYTKRINWCYDKNVLILLKNTEGCCQTIFTNGPKTFPARRLLGFRMNIKIRIIQVSFHKSCPVVRCPSLYRILVKLVASQFWSMKLAKTMSLFGVWIFQKQTRGQIGNRRFEIPHQRIRICA